MGVATTRPRRSVRSGRVLGLWQDAHLLDTDSRAGLRSTQTTTDNGLDDYNDDSQRHAAAPAPVESCKVLLQRSR